MHDDKDRSGKWLLQHHGNALLWLGGLGPVRSWRAVQSEVVQPKQLPDGLLEAVLPDRSEPDLFLVEIATYPEKRLLDQVFRDIALVAANYRRVPEVLTLVLQPRGKLRTSGSHRQTSRLGWTEIGYNWRVVEMWTLQAADLLAVGDVGLIPWVPLAQFDGSPEGLIQQCRDRIDQQAPPEERANLLAVTQVMTQLRFGAGGLLALLGGKNMINLLSESPLVQELMARSRCEARHQDLLAFLHGRFNTVPPDLAAHLRTITDEEKLNQLVSYVASCSDLESFRTQLSS